MPSPNPGSSGWRPAWLPVILALAAGCVRAPTESELRPPEISAEAIQDMAMQVPQAARALPRQVAERTASYLRHAPPPPGAAPALATAIRYSAGEAGTARQREIPDHVREALASFYDEQLLDQVRWVLPGRRVSLGSFLAGWYFAEGAVTLDDVVVFSDEDLAQNVWFWAHELAHVQQYRRLGVDGFAQAYVRDWRGLEAEATARADRVTAEIRRRKRAGEAARAANIPGQSPSVVERPPPGPDIFDSDRHP